jgi:hypothetical protein
MADPAWAAVVADKTAVILLKRTPGNRSVIERNEIPRERLVGPAANARR